MTTIKRSEFVNQHAGKSLDLQKVEGDATARAELQQAGLTTADLRRADKNRDGVLSADEAFTAADRFDNDGNANTLIKAKFDGATTQAGKATHALGMQLMRHGLQPDVDPSNRPGNMPAPNDEVLMVGMNRPTRMSAGAPHEHNELKKTGAKITFITDSKAGADKIRAGGTVHDLTTPEGRLTFTNTLGLPPAQSQKVADAIGRADPNGKDELAQIAQVWARGERGESIPSRMVLSGHHVGSGVWGDDNGKINWDSLKALSQAMPKAAGQVEDLHISACYSGGEAKKAMYQEIFPNVKTVWAYSGSAPGAGSGATVHQAAWERATRGRNVDVEGAAQRLKDRGVRKADVIDASRVGAAGPNGPSLEQLKNEVNSRDAVFSRHFTGQEVQQNTQSGPLRDYYNHVQRLLQHPGLTGTERRDLEARRDQTIRTIFYQSHVAHRFAEANAPAIREGYQSLGLPVPNFGTMSRAEAMESIALFRTRLDHTNPKPASAQQLLGTLNGLWNLDSQTIPEHWI